MTRSSRWLAACASLRAEAAESERERTLTPASEAHPVLATILWSLALTAVFAPFALRAYARRTGTASGLAVSVMFSERDGLRVAVLEMSWVTGQTVFADGGLALHSPIDAYGQVQRVIARRQAGSAER